MLDGDDDTFLLDDEGSTAKKAERLGLCVPEKFAPGEIEAAERAYRNSPCGRVLFVEIMEDGSEVWADDEPEKWRRYLGWPQDGTVRVPTIAEAMEWQRWVNSTAG